MTKHGLSEMYFRAARRGAGRIGRADIDAVRAARPHADGALVRVAAPIGNLADQMPMNIAGAAILGYGIIASRPAAVRFGLRFLATHFVGIALKTAAKGMVTRSRPNEVARTGELRVEPGGTADPADQSFPSGHAVGAVVAARAVAREIPAAAPYAYGAAAIASLVQIPQCNHYPSDIAAGVLIGLAADAVTERAYSAWERRHPPG